MGSTSPPETPPKTVETGQQEQYQQNQLSDTDLPASEFRRLLEQRDQEIRSLKFELEKYKLALHQSQLDYHYVHQQQQTRQDKRSGTTADDNIESLLESDTDQLEQQSVLCGSLPTRSTQTFIGDVECSVEEHQRKLCGSEEASDTAIGNSNISKESSSQSGRLLNRQSITSASSNVSASSSKVVFQTGADEQDFSDENRDDGREISTNIRDVTSDALQEIIQDVGEIDLDLEFKNKQRRQRKRRLKEDEAQFENNEQQKQDDEDGGEQGEDEDEDIISDGLLTSLTDAAISNLSQLAALQERCESQQHSHRYQQQQSETTLSHPQSLSQQQGSNHPITSIAPSRTANSVGLGSICRTGQSASGVTTTTAQDESIFNVQDPFTSSVMASQAALAISGVSNMQSSSSMITHLHQTNSSSSSISPNSTIQADLSNSHSLASVVAAAAVAAAAANDQQQLQHHYRPTHQLHSTPQSRLVSSALPSPEFYHNLQQQQQHPHTQQTSLQHQMSPVSSLHFSPSTSITPSPSSLMTQSRRSASNASSSLLSPIASPNYLRRQFMPERMPILSPSPTSLTTGSSSGASSSLAHILQHHHPHSQGHQQRSASALAGPITSPSSTPLSGTGSTAVSPLMSSKNSSQARLNNMQIRHKFGYLGSGRAQFNSPHGFCLGLNQEIVVADTNNHRVCIFDKSGTYITQFGSPGKEEGQLWNPRKVAILHRPINGASGGTTSSSQQLQRPHSRVSSYSSHFVSGGNIQNTHTSGGSHFGSEPLYVVCDRGAERSRMQLFTKDGAFIKKIGIHYIDIVAGLAITQNGLIIVVDSVSPTVYIINGETGSLNGWFDCSGHMKEPSDIAVKSDVPGNEYFICDFKGHCVVVFSEQGEYLRKIGHDGLTSYPNGIDISDDGDILVGDSHGNRFHVVVFDRNGK